MGYGLVADMKILGEIVMKKSIAALFAPWLDWSAVDNSAVTTFIPALGFLCIKADEVKSVIESDPAAHAKFRKAMERATRKFSTDVLKLPR